MSKIPSRSKEVHTALSRQRGLSIDLPATIKGIRQTLIPVKIGDQVIDREVTYLKVKLPNGVYLECRLEGSSSLEGIVDILTEDPHFESVTKA